MDTHGTTHRRRLSAPRRLSRTIMPVWTACSDSHARTAKNWRNYIMSTSQHIFTGRGTPPPGPSPVRRYFHCESGGWVYRNHKNRSPEIRISKDGEIMDEITRTVSYLLSHPALEFGPSKAKHLYRRFGLCSSRRLKVKRTDSGTPVIRKVVESVLICPICSQKLVRCSKTSDGFVPVFDCECDLSYAHCKRIYHRYEVVL